MITISCEQKNSTHIRAILGHLRYDTDKEQKIINSLYRDVLAPYKNFFQPVMKLVSKTRHGAKVHKVYDTARTPYQRTLESGVLTEAKQQELATIYHGLNPVLLLKQTNENLESLWKLAVLPAHEQKKAMAQKVLVT